MMRHICDFVAIVTLPDDHRDNKDTTAYMIVLPYDPAVTWVNKNRDLVDNAVIHFYNMDHAFENELDAGEIDLEDLNYTRLSPRFGADWQSTKCDAFVQLFNS